jgi:hypothetical protein
MGFFSHKMRGITRHLSLKNCFENAMELCSYKSDAHNKWSCHFNRVVKALASYAIVNKMFLFNFELIEVTCFHIQLGCVHIPVIPTLYPVLQVHNVLLD